MERRGRRYGRRPPRRQRARGRGAGLGAAHVARSGQRGQLVRHAAGKGGVMSGPGYDKERVAGAGSVEPGPGGVMGRRRGLKPFGSSDRAGSNPAPGTVLTSHDALAAVPSEVRNEHWVHKRCTRRPASDRGWWLRDPKGWRVVVPRRHRPRSRHRTPSPTSPARIPHEEGRRSIAPRRPARGRSWPAAHALGVSRSATSSRWLTTQQGRLRPTTHSTYQVAVRRICLHLGATGIQALTPLQIERFYADLAVKRNLVAAES